MGISGHSLLLQSERDLAQVQQDTWVCLEKYWEDKFL